MGVNVSSQMTDSLTVLINESMTKISNDSTNVARGYSSARQRMVIDMGYVNTKGGNFIIGQTLDLNMSTMLNNVSTFSSDMANDLTAKLQKTVAASLAQSNSDLNLGQTNISAQDIVSRTVTHNSVANAVSTSISNVVTTTSDNVQYLHVKLLGLDTGGGDSIITQEAIIRQLSENIAANIVNNVIKNSLSADVIEKIDLAADQKNKGVDIFAMFTIFIVVVVLGIGGFAYLRTGGGDTDGSDDQIGGSDSVQIGGSDSVQIGGSDSVQIGGGGDKMLMLKLALGCGAILTTGYFGIYAPEKQKIKDKYDISKYKK